MLLRALSLALAISAGCGRIGFDDETARSLDGGGDGNGGGDGATSFSAWSQPHHLTNLQSAANEWEATIDPTGLVLVFTRDDGSGANLMVSTRPSITAEFEVPALIPAASTPADEYGAAWSPDGTQLYFYSGGGSGSARYLTYQAGAFSAISMTAADLPQNGFSWVFTTDGHEVFYTTNPSNLEYDLHHATRTGTTGPFTVSDGDIAMLQRAVGNEGWPTLDSSQNTLYFERTVASGNNAIQQATRTAPGLPFGAPIPVDYPTFDDGDPDLSNNDLTLVFDSTRLGGGLRNELFIMTRTVQ